MPTCALSPRPLRRCKVIRTDERRRPVPMLSLLMLGRGSRGGQGHASRIALSAKVWNRYVALGGQYPVVAQNSCSMTPLSFFRAGTCCWATSFLTCCCSCIVSTMMPLLSHMLTHAGQHHSYLLSFHDDVFAMGWREITMI